MSAFTLQWTRAAASGLLGSKVTGRTSRSDTAGSLRPSELRVKCVPAVFVFVFVFLPFFRQGDKRQEGKGILGERGDVKGRSPSPSRWNITARPGLVFVSDAPREGREGGAAANEEPPGNEIDEELLTESSTVGKSSALMLCCLYSLLWKECWEDLILS